MSKSRHKEEYLKDDEILAYFQKLEEEEWSDVEDLEGSLSSSEDESDNFEEPVSN